MDSIKAAVEPINTVPREFWYFCTLLLVGVVIYFIKDFLSGLKLTLKELQGNVIELSTLIKLHDKELKDHADDLKTHSEEIKELQKKPRR